MATKRNTTPARIDSNLVSSPLRALMLFDTLPDGHQAFPVPNDACGVHLRQGEFAVVDLMDRNLQHGELYVIQYDSGSRRRHIVQARRSMCQITPLPSPEQEVWWTGDLAGFRKVGSTNGPAGDKIPEFAGLSDGPYKPDDLMRKLIGRIVGYAETDLGEALPVELGWEDEAAGNATFDPGEYLDVMISTGHKPYVIVHPRGKPGYAEMMPLDAITDDEWKDVMVARTKYCAASTAHERVVLECIRRGLVEAA